VVPLGAEEQLSLRLPAPSLLMTIESAVAQVKGAQTTFTLDRSSFLAAPRDARLVLRTPATASRVAVLSFHPPVLAAVAKTYRALGVDGERLSRALARLELLPRTSWIHELVHRYVFERCTCGHDVIEATAFLETELVKELYFLFRDRDAGSDRASLVHWHAPCVQKALAHIESHLFHASSIASLAKRSGASESTLLRAFHRELGCSPAAYWRSRKLDEALVLLRAGSRSVGEVAGHVGYDNATAFAFAFRSRFGRPPSAFLPRRPTRPAP
jgi:AraC-like DNA-binding protein